MGCCSARCTLVSICIFQMVFVIERTVLDALGPMYGLVVADGIQFLMVIVGIIGTYTYKPRYLVPYGTFQFLWIGWNAYLLCFYLEVGWLARKANWEYPLTMSLQGEDFFDRSYVTCNGTLAVSSITEFNEDTGYRVYLSDEHTAATRPDQIWELLYTWDPDCLIRPLWFKLAQCAIQISFSFFTVLYVCYIVYGYADEDDCFDFIGGFDHFNPGYPEGMKTGPPPQQHQAMAPIYQMQQPPPGMQHGGMPMQMQQQHPLQHQSSQGIQPHHSLQSQQSSMRGGPMSMSGPAPGSPNPNMMGGGPQHMYADSNA
jgi:hypothetical protein